MKDLESLMAEYLSVDECIAFGMGFATNALNIPTLAGKVKKLILSVCQRFIVEFLGRFDTQ